MKKEYMALDRIEGPLIELSGIENAVYGEIIEIKVDGHKNRMGRVIKIEEDKVIVQVFESTAGMSTRNTAVSFTGEPFEISSEGIDGSNEKRRTLGWKGQGSRDFP